MLWAFSLLLPVILAASSASDECNYVTYWGMPYATDRCNSYFSRSSYYSWEQSYTFRCEWDGSGVYLEWYDNWNCSGWPYYWSVNASNQFNCNGTDACYMSVTGFYLDQPCGETYTDSYWYTVYSQDVCASEDSWYFDSLLTCNDNEARINMFYPNNTCSGDSAYSYSYSETCNTTWYYPYNKYKINCSAADEPLPTPEYQQHYCDINDCTTYPTPAPTTPYYSQINRNNPSTCAYVNWYGEAVVPNKCFYNKYSWGNYSYSYSTKFQCNKDNTGVDILLWYGSDDCTSGDNTYTWNYTYGVTDFNCIGHTDCHASYSTHALTNTSDPQCSTASTTPTSYWVYATDICAFSYYGYPQKITCQDDEIKLTTYWNYTGCGGQNSQWKIKNGCHDQYNSSYYHYYSKYGVSCTPYGNENKSSADSTITTAVISVTVVIVVLILIGVVFVTYLTRKSRLQTKIDRTGMLSDGNVKGDEIFNDDGRGIRNTTGNTNTNTGFQPAVSDFNPPITNTIALGEQRDEFPNAMSLVGMQGDDDDGDNLTR